MSLVAISTATNPVTTGSNVDVTGTSDPAVTAVHVFLTDQDGLRSSTSIVTPSADAWSAPDIDPSALAAGTISVTALAYEGSTIVAVDVAQILLAPVSGIPGPLHATCTAWATSDDVRNDYISAGITPAEMDDACWVASDLLYALTGSRWPGVCHESKLRPQARWRQYDRPQWWQTANWMPLGSRTFSRYGWCSCNRGRDWGCMTIPEIQLPHYPVHKASIVVMVDGNQFDGWDLRDGCWLQRTDLAGWPCCQQTQLPDTEVGTWSVTFDWGNGPDMGGVHAAAILGYHLALAYRGDKKCGLPERVRQLTRGGTSIALLDPLTLFSEGLTGLTPVDLWVASKMVGNTRRPATISSVGRMPRYRQEN